MKIVGLNSALRTAFCWHDALRWSLALPGATRTICRPSLPIARPATVCRAKAITATTPCLASRDSNPNISRTNCGRSSSTDGKTRSWPMWRMPCRRRCCRDWRVISRISTRHRWAGIAGRRGDGQAHFRGRASRIQCARVLRVPRSGRQGSGPNSAAGWSAPQLLLQQTGELERGTRSEYLDADSSAVMGPTSHNLTKSQIAAVAAYVSGLSSSPVDRVRT